MTDYVNEHFATHNGFPFPRVVCADGFSLSVQAGRHLYSIPRESATHYSAVEVGFPSARESALMPYMDSGDGDDDPTQTVYGYVPIDIVNVIIASHGGVR